MSLSVFELIELTRAREREAAQAAARAHQWTTEPRTGQAFLAAFRVRVLGRGAIAPSAAACCAA